MTVHGDSVKLHFPTLSVISLEIDFISITPHLQGAPQVELLSPLFCFFFLRISPCSFDSNFF